MYAIYININVIDYNIEARALQLLTCFNECLSNILTNLCHIIRSVE